MIRRSVAAFTVVAFAIAFFVGHITDSGKAAAYQDKPFNQEQALSELKKRIAGQEQKPAEEVFKNIQLLKGVPAGRLLAIMQIGYSKSLGVDCTHCHVADQWEKEDKPTKQIAREMAQMSRAINTELLKKIKNLKSENPVVNCTTCHRGQTKPALNLP
jgi:Photosynthetic reaction centre cytochrome C subunit